MKKDNIPNTVGLIMDGNGRWANNLNKPRLDGHTKGIINMISLVVHAFECGIQNMVCYGLSTENLMRPKQEVEHIFDLVLEVYDYFIMTFKKIGASVKYVGNLNVLPEKVQASLKKSEAELEEFRGKHILYVSIAYGSRSEIVSAINSAIQSGNYVTEDSFLSMLSVPIAPDLIIRTGGQKRLSNFLLYQASYSELFFSDKMFPDFNCSDFDDALEWYKTRKRTYGII